jgi:hypothetical protein
MMGAVAYHRNKKSQGLLVAGSSYSHHRNSRPVNNRLLAQSGYAKANNMVDTKWRNRPDADIACSVLL